MSITETKERILDAAERLFSEEGFLQASTRQITKDAGVNVAAVNYHFGSKELLLEAVIKRRIDPINATRMSLLQTELEAAENEARPPSVEALIRALVLPLLSHFGRDEAGSRFHLLSGRIVTDPDENLRNLFLKHMGPILIAFLEAFRLAQPQISKDDTVNRIQFCIGAMIHAIHHLHGSHPAAEVLKDSPEAFQVETVSERLIRFLVRGMEGP